jgi:hypothetical protein
MSTISPRGSRRWIRTFGSARSDYGRGRRLALHLRSLTLPARLADTRCRRRLPFLLGTRANCPMIPRPAVIIMRHMPGASDLLPDHHPMAVGRRDGHLAHAPEPVGRRLSDDRSALHEFRVQRVHIVDVQISKNNCGRRFAPGASHRDNGQSSSGRRREKAPASSYHLPIPGRC